MADVDCTNPACIERDFDYGQVVDELETALAERDIMADVCDQLTTDSQLAQKASEAQIKRIVVTLNVEHATKAASQARQANLAAVEAAAQAKRNRDSDRQHAELAVARAFEQAKFDRESDQLLAKQDRESDRLLAKQDRESDRKLAALQLEEVVAKASAIATDQARQLVAFQVDAAQAKKDAAQAKRDAAQAKQDAVQAKKDAAQAMQGRESDAAQAKRDAAQARHERESDAAQAKRDAAQARHERESDASQAKQEMDTMNDKIQLLTIKVSAIYMRKVVVSIRKKITTLASSSNLRKGNIESWDTFNARVLRQCNIVFETSVLQLLGQQSLDRGDAVAHALSQDELACIHLLSDSSPNYEALVRLFDALYAAT